MVRPRGQEPLIDGKHRVVIDCADTRLIDHSTEFMERQRETTPESMIEKIERKKLRNGCKRLPSVPDEAPKHLTA
jgi:hypothetical protein